MTNLFTPVNWLNGPSGNTPITAERGPQRWEAGIEAIDDALDALSDRVAAQGGGISGPFGPSSARPQPTAMTWFLDTTLGYPICGTGTGWIKADGTHVTTVARPENFTAVGNSDNSIDLSWDPVAGASFYTLYEDRSPNGVSGATALTTTSSHRGPFTTLGHYRYWVTATIAGVESPISDYGIVVLPTSGGSGSGTTPATILNIGTGSGQNHFNEGIGFSTGHVDIAMSDIIGGYDNAPYFTPTSDHSGVLFRVYMNGGTTSSNTHYPRSELRAMQADGVTKEAFDVHTGTHGLSGSTKVTHLAPNKPWVVICQMHDDSSDTIQIMVYGDTTSSLKVSAKINGAYVTPMLDTSYNIGDTINWKWVSTNGTVKFYIDNTLIITSTAFVSTTAAVQYRKAGCYAQSSATYGGMESPTEYMEVVLSNLVTIEA